VDFIGAGGMGEVYRAVHSKIGRVAAVKVLTQAALSGGLIERFFNEARIHASLQHPNIATLYDFLEVGGQPCIIMEFIDGETLAERIRPRGPLPLSETVRIFQSVVEAVSYIHEHGIVHRDIKSNNIKLSSTGCVKLLDFGIAKGRTSPGLTVTGSIIGTLEYISPEQLMGGVADARSDIWALGVLLYEMVTGRIPFEAQTLGDLCDRIKNASYPPVLGCNPAIPRQLENIISRCLKRNPADRYQSAQGLLEDLKRLSTPAPKTPTIPALIVDKEMPGQIAVESGPQVSWARKNWILLTAAAAFAGVVFLAVITVAIYMVASSGGANSANEGKQPPVVSSTDGVAGAAGAQQMATIEISVVEGQAEVYRGDQLLGKTPYYLKAPIGQSIDLTLKRSGFADKNVELTISPNKKVYTYMMESAENSSTDNQ